MYLPWTNNGYRNNGGNQQVNQQQPQNQQNRQRNQNGNQQLQQNCKKSLDAHTARNMFIQLRHVLSNTLNSERRKSMRLRMKKKNLRKAAYVRILSMPWYQKLTSWLSTAPGRYQNQKPKEMNWLTWIIMIYFSSENLFTFDVQRHCQNKWQDFK